MSRLPARHGRDHRAGGYDPIYPNGSWHDLDDEFVHYQNAPGGLGGYEAAWFFDGEVKIRGLVRGDNEGGTGPGGGYVIFELPDDMGLESGTGDYWFVVPIIGGFLSGGGVGVKGIAHVVVDFDSEFRLDYSSVPFADADEIVIDLAAIRFRPGG